MANPIENPAVFDRYDILIRGSRRVHEDFSTIDELRAAVRSYLSPSEVRSGVLERLTNFNPRNAVGGVVTLKYRNIETWASLSDPE